MDGLELSRETRRLSPDTRIIIFSGYNDFEYAKTAITIGVQDYLMKPIVPADFAATVSRLISAIEEDGRLAEQMQKRTRLLKSHRLLLSVNNCLSKEEMDAISDEYSHLMMLECEEEFFSQEALDFQEKLEELLPFTFDYLNLYPTRSLIFIRQDNEARFKKEFYLLSAAQTISCLPERNTERNAISLRKPSGTCFHQPGLPASGEKNRDSFFLSGTHLLLPDNSMQSQSVSGHISMDMITDDLKLKDYGSLKQHMEEILTP